MIIDGGNSNYQDSHAPRRELVDAAASTSCDAGTSGGIWGLENGYCLMVGGDDEAYARLEPVFETLAPEGWLRCTSGPPGAGHFVKMVHNGIEYGMMQAYAEGFEILQTPATSTSTCTQIAGIWRHGSVVRSWLLELAERRVREGPRAGRHRAATSRTRGEGRWTVQEAIDQDVPAPVITLSLLDALPSRQDESFSAKVLAALRNEFGGHAVKKAEHAATRRTRRGAEPAAAPGSGRRRARACAMVIFGASGDLAHRKLVAGALQPRARARTCRPPSASSASPRAEYAHDEYQRATCARRWASSRGRSRWTPRCWQDFAAGIRYVAGSFDDPETFARLRAQLEELDKTRSTRATGSITSPLRPAPFPRCSSNSRRPGSSTRRSRRAFTRG